MNSKDEVIIKIIGKMTLEFPELDQLKVRDILEESLYKYDVTTQEVGLITTDVDEKLALYLAVKRLEGLSEKTLKNYLYNLQIFAGFLKKPLATVKTNDIRMFLANRCRNMKSTTTNSQISILKSFFAYLYNEDYIPKNPMVKIKQSKTPKRLRHALTDEEVENLRQACVTDREMALMEFLISSGCRLSEVTSININKINWSERSLNVIGKGNKERKVYFSTKCKNI